MTAALRFDILTLFPGMFDSPLDSSLLRRARERGIIDVRVHDIRQFAVDRHRVTDDAPYGGGGGMVMKVEPIDRALASLDIEEGTPVILLTPQGETFNQPLARELASHRRIVMICGHYEGVDERVRLYLVNREISIGDYILTGGEPAALVVMDAVSRLVPGFLGNEDSSRDDSFMEGLLEYPQYTRPAEYRGWRVPEVLLSGNHREIIAWRRSESIRRTRERRPDLWARLAEKGEVDS
ncbi:MAG TPA: tRNA (guanosine(37)-N1)-methyltransferase TrmD [Syntrophales bacterium]|nr:tRNA (guanosine(37)-N1)-methyltransferase TrmD [Syntrophales bacterium]HOM07252.1 tRNA (guanosine(37)-N1)-methyltransferase TrmD [Syntrophales bacterium]HON99732.1 tRNA (guanosine(37)-N1)-methyltransferase TrmD [Syntrophales bacterium]HPC01259.1 tRNA (guanosine(37)-N1)-methyltransferase TrmD [Syntrophales bacterium]HPQ06915.1 tRNA (guanosine(37)-N1)-methyltransferase TrmD [Syntrophales bacterium]